jgi:hypothetical protein
MCLGHREARSESIQVQTLDADSCRRGHTFSATLPSEIAIPCRGTVLIPGEAAHQNEMMSPIVTE